MIKRKGRIYKLDTLNTTLLIGVTEKHAEYLYYGKKLAQMPDDCDFLCGIGYVGEPERKLFSSFGGNDLQSTGVLCEFADGSFTTRFEFLRARFVEKPDISPWPASYVASENKSTSQTLCLEFLDEPSKLKLFLYYTIFEDSDVIAVSTRLRNGGKKDAYICGLPSLQLDLAGDNYTFVTFRGEWANERNKRELSVNGGSVLVNESRLGASSHTANPFVMLKKPGSVYAFNLIYSGNHKETAESDFLPRTRVTVGVNDFMLRKKLAAGEDFFTPEAVMCFASDEDSASRAMHGFVSSHIVRGKWKDKERPVLINNWEATYFDFTKEKIWDLANVATDLGIELLVIDDGWFGHRDDDTSSLGDWFDYEQKTGGIAALAEGIRERGLKFGIWVEPESISEDSELYKKHPEYVMKVPGREPLRWRNQLMLNLADVNVQKYLIRVISNVITETKATYVKWDYNRHMTDCFSKEGLNGAYFIEYMKGFYTVVGKIVSRFPSVLFEGCAGGGGRFDLGILCYMPQIWTSDNTDARCRMKIQTGTSFGYPQSSISCHVSASPNHQTGNASSLETRFNVAACGVFGYETDLTALTDAEKETVKKQITFYKKYRKVLQYGEMYRLGDAFQDEISGFICVDRNKTLAIASVAVDPRWKYANRRVTFKGLDEGTMYEVSYRLQDNYPEEQERFLAGGDLLMNGGVVLKDILWERSAERSANGLFTKMFVIKKISAKAARAVKAKK